MGYVHYQGQSTIHERLDKTIESVSKHFKKIMMFGLNIEILILNNSLESWRNF